jgi:hypothetical protein
VANSKVSLTLLAVIVVGLSGLAFAQTPLPSDSSAVVINGHRIPSKVVAGQVLVTPEDFARAIGATLSYSPSGMSITMMQGNVDPSEITALNSGKSERGRVRGTLTFFFNSNYGNKPDAGSQVWLVEGPMSDIAANDLFLFDEKNQLLITRSPTVPGGTQYSKEWGTQYQVFRHTIADGNGNFELSDVPVGQYTLIRQSNHAKGSAGKITQRDISGRLSLISIEIKPGETLDASWDFGRTVY